MTRAIPIGEQEFEFLRTNNCFYVDKTAFIGDWWRERSRVTVITRPRRFGKTLLLDTVASFFSNARCDQAALFGDLAVWRDEAVRPLAGTRPVVGLTFSGVMGTTAQETRKLIAMVVNGVFSEFRWLRNSPALDDTERQAIAEFSPKADAGALTTSLRTLSEALHKHFGVKPIILLDEFDTPLLAAAHEGYEEELVAFLRSFMDCTFLSNQSLERGLLMGVTSTGTEAFWAAPDADVVTTLTDKYQTAFGFTEAEVFDAMEEFGLTDQAGVKQWYDGYAFGSVKGIYNPWAITCYLERRKLGSYWMQTGSLASVERLLVTEDKDEAIKRDCADLIAGESIEALVEASAARCSQRDAVWARLLEGGYLRVVEKLPEGRCKLVLVNGEVKQSIRERFCLP